MSDDPKTETFPRATEQTERLPARAHDRWWLAGTIFVVAWCCLRFPQTPASGAFDPSLAAVLVQAHEHGLQFGRDIANTYGPLGFLSFEYFAPGTGAVRIVFELAVAAGVAAGLCLAAWRMALPWRLVVLGYFIFFTSTERWGGGALFLDLGIFLWGCLCFSEQGPKRNVFVAILSVLAATAALVKFSFLLSALFTIGLLACDFALQRRFAAAGGLLAGFVAAFAGGWLFLGQSLSNLPAYLAISLDVADGYNRSAGSTSVDPSWLVLMTVSAFAAATVRISGTRAMTKSAVWRRSVLLLWFAGLLFTEWKYGCVRSDWAHAAMAAGVIPLMAVCAQSTPTDTKMARIAGGMAALLCVATPLLFIQSQIEGSFFAGHVRQIFQNLAGSAKVLTRPASYFHEQKELCAAQAKRNQLQWIRTTVGNATIDVFGQNQVIAILNELNYRPRPFFQSYAANTAESMRWNERYYQSAGAPEYVLFELAPLDERFPTLEDASTLRELLFNYELAGSEADYLLLRKKNTANLRMTLVKQGELHAGDKLDLRAFPDSRLWLEIRLRPSWYGRLLTFFYKSPETMLRVWSATNPATSKIFPAPAPMLSAGFLASPLILENGDVSNFMTGAKSNGLAAFSVESSTPAAWQDEIDFQVYRVER